ncbi:MAG: alanine racemase [Patescibacteria group bacterium]|nr:alanine racemase [Patescibacteria group bacterium]
MINFLRKIIKPKYNTLNRIEIDAEKIVANFNYLKSLQPEAELFPVLKANAYGHGLKEICEVLNYTDAKMIAVDSYPEAQIAYKYFKGQVLIIGEMPQRVYNYCKLKRTEFVIYNSETLKYVSRFKKKAKIHLFINSGMNREGIKDIVQFVSENKAYLDKVEVSGICSHFSRADSRSLFNSSQEDVFLDALDKLRSLGYFPRWIHLGNSAAIFWSDNRLLTAFRPGLALYGYNPLSYENEMTQNLQPALEIYSQIVSLQKIAPGESVSYGDSYQAQQSTQIAIIPFGYYEGLDRRLSNEAQFLVFANTEFMAKIAGKVCMNLSCLDVGQEEVNLGDEVQIISNHKEALNSVENISSILDTIPYEFLVKLQPSIRRVLINLANIK